MRYLVLFACLALTACAENPFQAQSAETVNATLNADAPMTGAAPPPPTTATTEESFDTTSAEERAAAAEVKQPEGERNLGTTIVSLGSPTDPGFWLATPLVDTPGTGRVVAEDGTSVNVDLRPTGGAATAGSRLSLPALRLLGVGLTGLHTVTVYAE